ncbi:MAG: hypothetical protein H0U60_02475 [Blastocatellia bacterium]|nr:hypothetical protein [Blastocatellia bacterium]
MALLRARVEETMIKRLRRYMLAAQMAVDPTGANPDLTDPLATALQEMGNVPADVLAIGNTDLAAVAGADNVEFLDRVELRLLKNILGNLPETDMSAEWGSESRNQLPERVRQMILDKEKTVMLLWGAPGAIDATDAGSNSLTGGVLVFNFEDRWID